MKQRSSPRKRILLIGGGHTHALVLRQWSPDSASEFELALVTPFATLPYTGMLPGHVAGHYDGEEIRIDLLRLAQRAGADFVRESVVRLDIVRKIAFLSDGTQLPFDVASVNIGISSDIPSVDFGPLSTSVKPLVPFVDAWNSTLPKHKANSDAPRIVIVGAGLGGCELALAMSHRLCVDFPGQPASVTVVESHAQILASESTALRKAVDGALDRAKIEVRTGVTATAGDKIGLLLDDGARIPADLIAVAVGAHPAGWLRETALPLQDGFVRVNAALQAESYPMIFAAGDIAHFVPAPIPKAGVFAVREAEVLHHNLKAQVLGHALRQFRPQHDYLRLVSCGGKRAIAAKWGLAFSLPGLWFWKDRIDRGFVRGLSE